MRHYLLSSTCVVACQADVIKHMLYRLILRGRIDKWAYTLIEYDLTYEPLRSLKGQVLADFIIEHGIELIMKSITLLLLTRNYILMIGLQRWPRYWYYAYFL
jgi:hypothetical protein